MNSLTHQVSVMTQSYEELIEELRERNSNGLIFLPFETLHRKILLEGTFGDGLYAQIIDHPSVSWLDKFILADVFISNSENDHFTLIFSEDINCRARASSSCSGGCTGGLPIGDFSENQQQAFIVFDASQENNAYPRWGQWT